MKETVTTAAQNLEVNKTDAQEKRAYATPELKEHGGVQEVTLQTFFGSFSP